jgi:hypothetical protein
MHLVLLEYQSKLVTMQIAMFTLLILLDLLLVELNIATMAII